MFVYRLHDVYIAERESLSKAAWGQCRVSRPDNATACTRYLAIAATVSPAGSRSCTHKTQHTSTLQVSDKEAWSEEGTRKGRTEVLEERRSWVQDS